MDSQLLFLLEENPDEFVKKWGSMDTYEKIECLTPELVSKVQEDKKIFYEFWRSMDNELQYDECLDIIKETFQKYEDDLETLIMLWGTSGDEIQNGVLYPYFISMIERAKENPEQLLKLWAGTRMGIKEF